MKSNSYDNSVVEITVKDPVKNKDKELTIKMPDYKHDEDNKNKPLIKYYNEEYNYNDNKEKQTLIYNQDNIKVYRNDSSDRYTLLNYSIYYYNNKIEFVIDPFDKTLCQWSYTFNEFNNGGWKKFYNSYINKQQADNIERIIYNDYYEMTDNMFKKVLYQNDHYYINIHNNDYLLIEFPKEFCYVYPQYKYMFKRHLSC